MRFLNFKLNGIEMRKIVWLSILFVLNSFLNAEELKMGEEDRLAGPIMINRDTFTDVVSRPTYGTFVMYFAPWCGRKWSF